MPFPAALRRSCFGRLTLAALATFAPAAFARGQEAVRLEPRPAWVDPLPVEVREGGGLLRGAVDHLLLDFQDDARGEELASYVHAAKRVLNEQGVQYESEISIDFDPTYQTLAVHRVALLRGGERIDALANQAFEVIQRESQLESQVYDGTRTALLFIEGVRVGDVIELEYTLRGQSPLFEGRYLSSFAAQLPVPVQRMRKRILWDAERSLQRQGHGVELEPEVRDLAGSQELVWDLRDTESLHVEYDVPSWFDAYPWIQLSEFESWNDVARWGAKLFALPDAGSPALRAAADGLRSETRDVHDDLRRALRFVQGEVRYLSIALGEGSHRPSPPDEVLARRYGDCKDKALLLVALLRELGIEARPALVSTTSLHAIEKWSATSAAFDHVIVRALAGGEEWWLDPTMTHERGPLSEQALLDYGRALVLDPETTDLAVVTRDQGAQALTTIEKRFEVRLDAPTTLMVETAYEGADATVVRSNLGWQTTQELTDSCRDFYMADYPSLTVEAPAEVLDHEDENRLVIREQYAIPDFWGRKTGDGWGRFYASEIAAELCAPETTRRATPAGLAHPRRIKCHTLVLLPQAWEIEPETVRVRNGSMSFEHRVAYAGRRLNLHDEYVTLRDHVPARECAAFAADVEQAHENLGYEISDPRAAPAGGLDQNALAILGAVIVGGAFILCLFIGAIIWISRRSSPSAAAPHALGDPGASGETGGGTALPRRGAWREGSLLAMELGAELPPRCIYCNRDESTRVRRVFAWHTPWLYVLILAGFLVYAIVAVIVNKRARLAIPLCRAHQRRRMAMRASVLALAVGGCASCVAGMGQSQPGALIVLGVCSVLLSLCLGFGSRLRPARIDDHHLRLRGAGKQFLASLAAHDQEFKRVA